MATKRKPIYDPDEICELCGDNGAYKILGTYICPQCKGEPPKPVFVPPDRYAGSTSSD